MPQNLNEVLKPNEMPSFWGSVARPELPTKIKLVYALGWLVALFAAGLQNNLTIANINQIQGYLGITPAEGAILTACYYMGYAWTSVVLFKIRQQFGMRVFFGGVVIVLCIAHIIQMFSNNFYVYAFSRFLNGLVGSGLSTFCAYYAMQMLPKTKTYLVMCVSVGLMQVGSPFARWLDPFLMLGEDAHLVAFIDTGTTLFVLAAYLLIELPPSQLGKAFSIRDIPSLSLYAIGTATCCLIFSLGTIIWWDKPWIAYGTCIGVTCIVGFFLIEINRTRPLINFSFVGTLQVFKLALAGAFARMCLTEQTTGATGLFRNVLGYSDYQLADYYGIVTLGALFGGLSCIVVMGYKRTSIILILSFAMLIVGSFASTNLSPQITPAQLYIPQFLIAAASVFFIGPLFAEGIIVSLSRGGGYVLTFIAIFSFSQSVFGQFGSALVSYFIKVRTASRLQDIINHTPETNLALNINPDFITQITKQAGVMAYSDLFCIVGYIAIGIFLFLVLHWLYFAVGKKTAVDRELAILGRRTAIANLRTKTFLDELEKRNLKENQNNDTHL
ncbi:hypothetical protein BKH42_04525 [Helicobacter sp. 13S00482-2]|uniref:MFS transporter n=1 Tax=Helicobacter sp. 13S00482-2 TaxID=1476200 RepID=UPI000BA67E7C|nr:MFS transporter [Helicobacter sp. 13S00482-2]PAF53762.1 hypothetical protein BKH42_04525 [Helicobacter sp. 13S00482-2]